MAIAVDPNARNIHSTNRLVSFWIFVSSFVVFWDLTYLFFRPLSFKAMGGQLAAFWPGYDLYETIDNVYSMKAWENKLGFPLAQATMNIVENVFNFTYLYLSHSSDENKRAASPVVGLIGVTMTCSKTVLYFLCDYYCGFCESGHNSWSRWLFMYLAPNCLWVLIPGALAVYFGTEIAERLRLGAGLNVGQGSKGAGKAKTK
ncbi:unnamed protein product [Jaminaea pallidilutea]